MGINARHVGFGMAVALWGAGTLAAGSDDLWEMTMKMEMPGFAMPPTKTTFCSPKDAAYNPQNDKMPKNCEILEMKMVGTKSMWRMRCTGKESFEGSGEVTRTGDTMNGSMKMVMNMGGKPQQMNQSYSAKRIGSCDAAAQKKKLEDDMNANRQRMCDQIAEQDALNGGMVPKMPDSYSRKDQCQSSKAPLCAKAQERVATYEGYSTYMQNKGWVAGECGINLETTRASLCQKSLSEKQYGFLKQSCPTEARTLYDQNCQGYGRGYTADATHPHAGLCRALWSARSTGVPAATAASAPASAAPAAKPQRPARREDTDEDKPRDSRPGFHF